MNYEKKKPCPTGCLRGSQGRNKMIDDLVVTNICTKQTIPKQWNLGGIFQFLLYADRIFGTKHSYGKTDNYGEKKSVSVNPISPQQKSGGCCVFFFSILSVAVHIC